MKIAVVATLYYSANYIDEFYARVVSSLKTITQDYEIVFVSDGSPDESVNKVLQLRELDKNITLIDLSRNFGHHKAIMTGLSYANADYIFLIDTDLEEDPELLSLLWAEIQLQPDTDVIYGIQKTRKGGWFERHSGNLYYKLFSFLTGYDYPANPLTARLMSKRYIDGLKRFTETEMDLWGLFILNGFNQKGIYLPKKSKGTSTYNFRRKIKIAIDSITTLSGKPLYFIFIIGLLATLLSIIYFITLFIKSVFLQADPDPLTHLISSIWLIGGIIMLALGIISIYLNKIFLEIKNRPLSIIKNIYKN